MRDAEEPTGAEVVDLDAARERHALDIEREKVAKPITPVTCKNRFAAPDEPAPIPSGPTISRLQVALDVRGRGPSSLSTDFVGWNAVDVKRDRRRAARGEFPYRALLGPIMEPIDEARLGAILAGDMPTEGEAATLSDALIVDGQDPWPREFFRKPPLPAPTKVHFCGGHHHEAACACGAPATLLCDEITGEGMEGTCDRSVCATCAIELGPEDHRCPEHRPAPRLSDAPWMGTAAASGTTRSDPT